MIYLTLITKRIFLALLTLLIVSAILYGLLEILPGDVATRILGRDANPENLAILRERAGLNIPPVQRYFFWLFNIMQGDLGYSLISTRPLTEILAPKIFNTLIFFNTSAIFFASSILPSKLISDIF